MSEETVSAVSPDEVTDGKATSEYKWMRIIIVLGGALQAASAIILQLQESGLDFPWFAIALAVIGGALQLLSYLGYNKGRSAVKVATAHALSLEAAAKANVAITDSHKAIEFLKRNPPPVEPMR